MNQKWTARCREGRSFASRDASAVRLKLALLIVKCLYFSLKSFIGIGLGAGAYVLSRCAVSIFAFPCDLRELWSSTDLTDRLWGAGKVAVITAGLQGAM